MDKGQRVKGQTCTEVTLVARLVMLVVPPLTPFPQHWAAFPFTHGVFLASLICHRSPYHSTILVFENDTDQLHVSPAASDPALLSIPLYLQNPGRMPFLVDPLKDISWQTEGWAPGALQRAPSLPGLPNVYLGSPAFPDPASRPFCIFHQERSSVDKNRALEVWKTRF